MSNVSDITAPAGYEIDDRRTGNHPVVEFRCAEFARCPTICLDTSERCMWIDGKYVIRKFWGIRTSAVSRMDEGALHDFIEALQVAQRLLVDLRAAEVASQPKKVLDAFEGMTERRESVGREVS